MLLLRGWEDGVGRRDEQDFLCLFVGAWLAVLVAVVFVGLHGFVGGGAGDELVAEAGLVVALDLWMARLVFGRVGRARGRTCW